MEIEKTLENLHYVPIFLFILIPTTFIATYIIAVTLGHVEAGFPYISDTATYPPESCIFAQIINMAAATMCVVIYIRYSHTKELSSSYQFNASLPKWNRAALILGLLTCLGLSMVANFQETNVIVVHLIGALVCFGCGTAYFWTQVSLDLIKVVCSYYLHPLGCSIKIAHLRLSLVVSCTILFIIGTVTAVLARLNYHGNNPRKWYKADGGWELHMASTVAEWLCAGCFCVYILTFTDEFRGVQLKRPKILFKPCRLRTSNEVLNESQDEVPQPKPPTTII
ncbi:DNA damage-regulated autophagy modulator protein 2 isoform X1 [Neodiprion pinetum]|uniref:DNA damage-regulated autophagy modulator protein 2 isoform X1 n=1 Tax=Neodiprion lecontei TaxID=441921 RepID=A0ABM3GJZ1_NEOLC|nr:DNA damage-regulated autophagy modulator protein 2 isoform X1 [Neodiprion fabricii]XP_046491206.1 DNA damage-regulated autophagy modulator protein 2 isoform X1 [Neodiprion pinetum]XP_046491207.1 DNA damage-regulated autophagy modulator protein 2 isoform X1 [Neodiprion pinetum]XP_046491208.1 DNA damage-regulated autophagy modulator protein 2 isoform X1 [Neodiprion pinetum]XP_046491209.1 DNA damage-regulated autophagy modulator protein 2 isoform X1 [Neodiprion pinetum]XP_046491210.1 DNA damag